MAIIRTASPKYFAPITFKSLSANGELQELKFDVQFKRIKSSEREAMHLLQKEKETQRQKDLEKGIDIQPQMTQDVKDLAADKVTGWRAVQEPDGTEVPYSIQALLDLDEEYAGLLFAVAQAYWQSINPTEAAHLAAKN